MAPAAEGQAWRAAPSIWSRSVLGAPSRAWADMPGGQPSRKLRGHEHRCGRGVLPSRSAFGADIRSRNCPQGGQRDPGFIALLWIAVLGKALGAVLALALVQQWAQRLRRLPLVLAWYVVGTLVLLCGVANLIEHRLMKAGIMSIPPGVWAPRAAVAAVASRPVLDPRRPGLPCGRADGLTRVAAGALASAGRRRIMRGHRFSAEPSTLPCTRHERHWRPASASLCHSPTPAISALSSIRA